mmetsp:Transcript_36520/g.77696  ORF Transcript_36520/g.77696 Transcript_36520/m.77696 type:complete len:233 (+) Transcript_36520:433-1131(+)
MKRDIAIFPWSVADDVRARDDLHCLLIVDVVLEVKHDLVDFMLLPSGIWRPDIALLVLGCSAAENVLVPNTDEVASNIIVRSEPVASAVEGRTQQGVNPFIFRQPLGSRELWHVEEVGDAVASIGKGKGLASLPVAKVLGQFPEALYLFPFEEARNVCVAVLGQVVANLLLPAIFSEVDLHIWRIRVGRDAKKPSGDAARNSEEQENRSTPTELRHGFFALLLVCFLFVFCV